MLTCDGNEIISLVYKQGTSFCVFYHYTCLP